MRSVNSRSDVGLVELLTLQAIAQKQSLHAYGAWKDLQSSGALEGLIVVSTQSMYRLYRRLYQEGLITCVGTVDNGKALELQLYSLTPLGVDYLRKRTEAVRRVAAHLTPED